MKMGATRRWDGPVNRLKVGSDDAMRTAAAKWGRVKLTNPSKEVRFEGLCSKFVEMTSSAICPVE